VSRLAISALVAITLGACAQNPPAGAASTPAPADSAAARSGAIAYGLVFPAQLHRYALTETSEVKARPADKIFRYSDGSETRVTVFFYLADSVAAARDPQQVVAQEGQLFLESLPLSVQRGWIESYSTALARSDSLSVDGRVVRGHVTTVTAKQARRNTMELQYVYLVGPRFVKVRASVPAESWPNTDVPRFAQDLATLLARQLHASRQGS
jgi:hypothetical protein